MQQRISSKSILVKNLSEYKNYVSDFSPLIIRREKPLSIESAMTNLKKLYYVFGFISKKFKIPVKDLDLTLVLKEHVVRSFFLQV